MNRPRTVLSLLVSLVFIINIAYAVTFSVSIFPSSIEISLNKLVNFTVTDTGGVNITQLNITLPPSLNFTGVSNTNTTNPYTSLTTKPSWTNTSSTGIVGAGQAVNFSIYVDTPNTTGSYAFNITTKDANDAFTSNNVSITLVDTTAPTFSSNTTTPSTNTTYAPNQTYWFNITWNDNAGISVVQIEHNLTGSGTPHNETMNVSSSVYYLNLTDLSAGTYVWKIYANDTSNNQNSTIQQNYTINKATPTINVFLDGRLNVNTTSIVNSNVNITANTTCLQSGCSITIKRDGGTIVSGASNPSLNLDNITSLGSHNYTVTVASNTNYSSNTATYFVATTPSYSTSTSNIPLTYSSAVGSINITFGSNSNVVNIYIEGAWSGTATNYTMSNTSLTTYGYSITFPAGTHTWRIYGNYSNHLFNLTALNSFTINQAAPTINLNITPQWLLDSPVQTNVSCTISLSGLTATLYRNATSVVNPDTQTFSAGSVYEYLCNNTVNQNYTTGKAINTLVIKPKPSASLTFVESPTLIEVTQNSTITSQVKVKNVGNVGQNTTLDISGIDKSWYSIDKPTVNILVGMTATFTITFNVGNVDVKDYSGKFAVSSSNATISQDFTLRVLPSTETKLKINDTLALYKLDVNKLESKFVELKAKINNTGTIEQKLNELRVTVKQAEDYVNSNKYFEAQQTFETIKALISEVENQLKVAKAPAARVEIPSNVWLIIAGVITVVFVGFIAYLFWPVKKGYKPETGYTYGGGKEKRSLLYIFKNLLSKFKRKKKNEIVLSELI